MDYTLLRVNQNFMLKPMKQYNSSLKYHLLMVIKDKTKANPIKASELKVKLGISTVKIRELVNQLRAVDHKPIGSDSSGYYYCSTISEASHTINQLRSRAKHIHRAADGILANFKDEAQLSLIWSK